MSQTQFTPPALHREGVSPAWRAITFYGIAAAGIALFVIPTFIIRPFRQQTPRALWLALALRPRAPLLTLIAAAICILLTLAMWKLAGGWRKAAIGVTLLLVVASAVMARLNYFEWMFHPIAGAQFQAHSSSKLDAKEMVMAVSLSGEARAYPISQMAYHHVLNDTVAGVPIMVTY
jgi:hypothetical protein